MSSLRRINMRQRIVSSAVLTCSDFRNLSSSDSVARETRTDVVAAAISRACSMQYMRLRRMVGDGCSPRALGVCGVTCPLGPTL
jgi:hypothetical protein